MRDKLTSLLEIASGIAIVIGAACASLALGWVVGGVLGLVYAWRLAR